MDVASADKVNRRHWGLQISLLLVVAGKCDIGADSGKSANRLRNLLKNISGLDQMEN